MTRSYFHFGKLITLLLAIGIPFILYRSLETRIDGLKRDMQLQSLFAEERNRLVRQVFERRIHSQDLSPYVMFQRELPKGAIDGLAPFPMQSFLSRCHIEQGGTSNVPDNWLALLHNTENFPSGLPKRYAGLMELLAQDHLRLSQSDYQKLQDVALQFWRGIDLDNNWYTFLLQQQLPASLASMFGEHMLFLGMGRVPADGRIWLSFQKDQTMKLAALPRGKQREINRDLQALRLDMNMTPASNWTDLGILRVSLKPESVPLPQRIRKAWWVHGLLLLVLESICLLLFLLFRKYHKVFQLQKQLLAATSHELRTPLAVIRQFSEMLVGRSQIFEKKTQTYHNFIYRECLKLQLLVENLLSAAKFENLNTKPNPAPFSLKPWLEDEISSLSQIMEEQNISLACPNLEVTWDRGLMSQILTNLVDNARKHARTDIVITIRTAGTQVEMEVRDFGETFDLEQLSKIRAFQPQNPQKTSLGLGLFLTQKMAEQHSGKLEFKNAQPGLAVVVHLPQRLTTAP